MTICEFAGVNVNWLLQGVGPKRGMHVDSDHLGVLEAIDELPADDRQQTFDFIRYKIKTADGWYAKEKLARYMGMLDKIIKLPKGTD